MHDNFIRELRHCTVKDGDTLAGTIRLGFNAELSNQVFRLYGVNAYETTRRGSWDNDLDEKEVQRLISLGKKAKKLLKEHIAKATKIFYQSELSPKKLSKEGKYGRWLGTLFLEVEGETIDWNQYLLDQGLGYEYLV